MPICFMPGRFPGKDKDEVRARALGIAPAKDASGPAHNDSVWAAASLKSLPADAPAHPEWREPPGYLGEAVRRAKRIASLSRADVSSKPASG